MGPNFEELQGLEALAFLKVQAKLDRRAGLQAGTFDLSVRETIRKGKAGEELQRYKLALWQFREWVRNGFPGLPYDSWPQEVRETLEYVQDQLIRQNLMPDVPAAARIAKLVEDRFHEEVKQISDGKEDIMRGAPKVLELREKIEYLTRQLQEYEKTHTSTVQSLEDSSTGLESEVLAVKKENQQLAADLSSKIDEHTLLDRRYKGLRRKYVAEKSKWRTAYEQVYDWFMKSRDVTERATNEMNKLARYAGRLEEHNEQLAARYIKAKRDNRKYRIAFWVALAAGTIAGTIAAVKSSQNTSILEKVESLIPDYKGN